MRGFPTLLLLAALALLAIFSASATASTSAIQSQSEATFLPYSLADPSSFLQYSVHGQLPGDNDPLSQVRQLIGNDAELDAMFERIINDDSLEAESSASFVEVGAQVGRVHSYCEICILVMQMKERGQPHLCAGLNTNYHITCIEVLESLLRADKAVVYWLKNGCMHMDKDGPEIVRPCPAINICSWVPNLFAAPPSLVRDGIESLCPKDSKFLPTIPQEFRNLLANADNVKGSAASGPVDVSTKGV
jgi:hypothetical protein